MLLLLLFYVVSMALWKIDVYIISTLVTCYCFFTVFNTFWTHMFIISSLLTVAEGDINAIYDDVSS